MDKMPHLFHRMNFNNAWLIIWIRGYSQGMNSPKMLITSFLDMDNNRWIRLISKSRRNFHSECFPISTINLSKWISLHSHTYLNSLNSRFHLNMLLNFISKVIGLRDFRQKDQNRRNKFTTNTTMITMILWLEFILRAKQMKLYYGKQMRKSIASSSKRCWGCSTCFMTFPVRKLKGMTSSVCLWWIWI